MDNIDRLIELSLEEDISSGDITTNAIVSPELKGKAIVIAEENFILSGVNILKKIFLSLNSSITFESHFSDGDSLKKGDKIITITGPVSDLLTGERTALNFLQRLSGISTLTNRYVSEVFGTKAKVVDTRKTTPGWRSLEKCAVLKGGGNNHRFGLYDGILIKDNHITVAGGIKNAVTIARNSCHHLAKIEVETETLDNVREALKSGADIIMLDNMSIDEIKEALNIINGKAKVEVSGNVKLANIREIAETGVDYISVGAITHSSTSVDISMDIKDKL